MVKTEIRTGVQNITWDPDERITYWILLFQQHQEDDFIYDHEKEHFSFLLPNPVRIIKIHYRNINPEQFKQQIAVFIIS